MLILLYGSYMKYLGTVTDFLCGEKRKERGGIDYHEAVYYFIDFAREMPSLSPPPP